MKLFRVLILGIILTLHSLSSLAVLRGYDINETVIMLNSELETFVGYVNTTIIDFSKSRDNYKKKMHEIRKELASAKLSLYSQQDQYIFGNAYASEYAQKFCEKFHQSELPKYIFETEEEILSAIEKTILFYKEMGIAGERFADTIERVGFSSVEEAVLSDEILKRKDEILKDE